MGPTGPTGGGGSEQTSPVVTWSSGGSPTIDLPEMTIVGSVGSANRAADAGRAANGGGTTSVPAAGAQGEVQQYATPPLNGTNQGTSSAGLATAGAVQSGADAGVSSSPAGQARSAPSADEGGIIAGGQAMSVQAAQSHSPQGTGGGPSMGAMRSGLEAASWIPGPIGSVAAATLVGIDIYQGNYGQAALGMLGIFCGRVATSGVRAVRDTKIVTAALEGLSGAGAKLGNAFAGWAKGFGREGGEVVQRWMSRAELAATQNTGLLRGGRGGTHYASDAVNSSARRAQQRLALPQTPDVRVTMSVPRGMFSSPSRVEPAFNMPGGGMERTASGLVPVEILRIDW